MEQKLVDSSGEPALLCVSFIHRQDSIRWQRCRGKTRVWVAQWTRELSVDIHGWWKTEVDHGSLEGKLSESRSVISSCPHLFLTPDIHREQNENTAQERECDQVNFWLQQKKLHLSEKNNIFPTLHSLTVMIFKIKTKITQQRIRNRGWIIFLKGKEDNQQISDEWDSTRLVFPQRTILYYACHKKGYPECTAQDCQHFSLPNVCRIPHLTAKCTFFNVHG